MSSGRDWDSPRCSLAWVWGGRRSDKAALLVIGRLLHPTNERGTALWGERISALGELLGTDFQHLGNNSLYCTSDRVVEHRDEIERRLAQREKGLFQLGERASSTI